MAAAFDELVFVRRMPQQSVEQFAHLGPLTRASLTPNAATRLRFQRNMDRRTNTNSSKAAAIRA